MSKRQLLSIIGLWNIFFLFLGIPNEWDKIISIFTGIVVIMIAYRMPFENKNIKNTEDKTFIENE